MNRKLHHLQSSLHRLENWILFFLVMAMLCLSITQIFLRNLFDFGLVWAEAASRLMVFWAAMIGSMVAARTLQHIRIDLIDQYAPDNIKKIVSSLVYLLTAFICFTLLYFSLLFLQFEYTDGTTAFANIPSWIFISIIPFAFLVMGIRYLSVALQPLLEIDR